MVIPSFLLLFVVVIIPIFLSVKESLLGPDGSVTFAHYTYLFKDQAMRKNIMFSLSVTLVSSALIIGISYMLAVYLRFSKSWMAKWMQSLYFIPMFIPSVIASYGLISLYGNHGWLSRVLLLFGWDGFPKIIFDYKGLLIANLWFNIPFAMMLLTSALSGIPNSVIESARDAGAGRRHIFIRFILPLTYKTMLVTLTFVFMGIIGSFTAPFLIGPNAPQVLGVAMAQIFSAYQETEQASATAVFMFLLCAVMGYVYIRSMIKEEKGGAR